MYSTLIYYLGGIIYDVIVEPPSVGSTTDEHGHTRYSKERVPGGGEGREVRILILPPQSTTFLRGVFRNLSREGLNFFLYRGTSWGMKTP